MAAPTGFIRRCKKEITSPNCPNKKMRDEEACKHCVGGTVLACGAEADILVPLKETCFAFPNFA